MMYIFFLCVCLCPLCSQGRGDIQPQLDSAMQDVSDKYILLEETEKQALRKALIEDRQRFCWFVAMLRPVVVSTAGQKEINESSDSTEWTAQSPQSAVSLLFVLVLQTAKTNFHTLYSITLLNSVYFFSRPFFFFK